MTTRYTAAVVQLNSGEDKAANLGRVEALVEQAAAQGARLVALPEMFNCLGRFATVVSQAESIPGPTSQVLSRLAARFQITLMAGSICERSEDPARGYNTSLLFAPDGELLAKYRKIHLFDVDLPGGVSLQESRWICPGSDVVQCRTPLGMFGLSICYDLRFAELYRRLADHAVEVVFVPAAFTKMTGKDHWEILLRARAIECQAYVIAPNQCGRHGSDLETYGNSMIIDPWEGLVRGGEDEGLHLAEIDLTRLAEIRQQLPALTHRKLC